MIVVYIYNTHMTEHKSYMCDVNDFGMGLWCVLIQNLNRDDNFL